MAARAYWSARPSTSFAHQLLGCAVVDGADRHVGRRQAADVIEAAGNTEVGQQNPLLIGAVVGHGDHDVGRFDIAVQQALLMCVVQRLGHGSHDPAGPRCWASRRVLFAQQRRGVGAVDVVHRDPQLAVELAAVVHPDDVRMPQVPPPGLPRGRSAPDSPRRRRRRRAGSSARPCRGSLGWRARYTSPIPPVPSSRTTV